MTKLRKCILIKKQKQKQSQSVKSNSIYSIIYIYIFNIQSVCRYEYWHSRGWHILEQKNKSKLDLKAGIEEVYLVFCESLWQNILYSVIHLKAY